MVEGDELFQLFRAKWRHYLLEPRREGLEGTVVQTADKRKM